MAMIYPPKKPIQQPGADMIAPAVQPGGSGASFMFPATPVVSTKINMNSDFFSSKVF